MKDFKRSGRAAGEGSGGRDHGRPNFHGGGGRSRVELFDAICAKCGKPCQVPFRPNGKKPVYCSECFGGTRQDVPSGDFRRSDRFEQREFRPQRAPDGGLDGIKRQLDSIEGKLDELMDALTESEES